MESRAGALVATRCRGAARALASVVALLGAVLAIVLATPRAASAAMGVTGPGGGAGAAGSPAPARPVVVPADGSSRAAPSRTRSAPRAAARSGPWQVDAVRAGWAGAAAGVTGSWSPGGLADPDAVHLTPPVVAPAAGPGPPPPDKIAAFRTSRPGAARAPPSAA